MKNTELRAIIKSRGVKFWQLADYLGISEATLTRLMRHDLGADKVAEVLSAVDQIVADSARAKMSGPYMGMVVEK